MNKHLHTFESHGSLDMPLNPAFYNYNQFKDYLHNEEVADLVNRLNDLWWENEAEQASDERANEIGGQLDRLEQQIKAAIINADLADAQQEQEDLDSQQEEYRDDVISALEKELNTVKDLEYEIENIFAECDYGICTIKLNLIIDEEEYNLVIEEEVVHLHDFDYEAELGKLEIYSMNHKKSEYNLAQSFAELITTEGESYIEFLKLRDDSL